MSAAMTYRYGYDHLPSDTIRAPIPDLPVRQRIRVEQYDRERAEARLAGLLLGLILLVGLGVVFAMMPSARRISSSDAMPQAVNPQALAAAEFPRY
jgi:hypothetical protein